MMVHQGAAAGQPPTTSAAAGWAPASWPPLPPRQHPQPQQHHHHHQLQSHQHQPQHQQQQQPQQHLPPQHHQHQKQQYLQPQHQHAATTTTPPSPPLPPPPAPPRAGNKRKAEMQNNERLSKRLSLLNLEQHGARLYVPVETASPAAAPPPHDDDAMLLDSAHKVYIYDLDDELLAAAAPDGTNGPDDAGHLVFLPDVERHLRRHRIPPHVLATPEADLAGMQIVLYSEPRSLTVPEERDGVHRAILDARRRLRERQRLGAGDQASPAQAPDPAPCPDGEAMDVD